MRSKYLVRERGPADAQRQRRWWYSECSGGGPSYQSFWHQPWTEGPGALTMNRDYGRPGLNQSSWLYRSSLARIDKRTARATGNTRYRYNQNGPLHHKMADSCVSALARTNTVSSTITTPIKTSKTSNESYSYNLLHCINQMYIHYFFFFFFYNKSGKRGLRLSINRFVQLNHN